MKWLMLLPLVEASIRGINFYGLETPRKDFVCSWAHSVGWYVDKLAELGFNSLRVPISLEYAMDEKCYKLQQVLSAAESHGMTVVLDMHRIFPDRQSYSPEEKWVTLDTFIKGWKTVLKAHGDSPALVGVDVFNEFQGTDAKYWNGVLRKVVTELEQEFPGRFIYYVGGCNWGGNVHDINLEDLPFSDRVRYTIHKYHFSGRDRTDWDYSFGPYADKLMVGEWGFKTQVQEEKEWALRFTSYLVERGVTDNYFWTIAHSGDTDGLWYDDCENINWEKYEIIKSVWRREPVGSGGLRRVVHGV